MLFRFTSMYLCRGIIYEYTCLDLTFPTFVKKAYLFMGHYQKSVDFGVFQIKKKSSMKPKNIMATTLLWYCNVKTHYRSLCWRVQFF